jgi:hypothetical protein
MNVQYLSTGRWSVRYGEPVPYNSPLWVVSSDSEEVVYADTPDGTPVARVYRKDNEWYLATAYLSHWQPIPTFSKYDGFLFLLQLHKKSNEL